MSVLDGSTDDPMAGLRDLIRRPREIRVTHAVPYGHVYRQWMTDGSLVVWANRGEIEDLPRVSYYGVEFRLSTLAPPGMFGIPVVKE